MSEPTVTATAPPPPAGAPETPNEALLRAEFCKEQGIGAPRAGRALSSVTAEGDAGGRVYDPDDPDDPEDAEEVAEAPAAEPEPTPPAPEPEAEDDPRSTGFRLRESTRRSTELERALQ